MAELNPQQIDFLRFYTDPTSLTFSNALQSALKANYSQEYAENITSQMPEWLSEYLGKKKRLLSKAEKNLESILDKGVDDKDSLKVVADTSKFIAETVGKDDYSKRNELTGKGGKDLPNQPILVKFINGKETEDNRNTSKETN